MSEKAYESGGEKLRGALWRRRWFQLALIWGIWTLVALFFSGQLYFMSLIADIQEEMSSPFFAQFSYCYLWALATPLVIWLAYKFPFERQRWHRSLPVHILSGILIVVLLSTAYHLSIYFWYSQGAKPYSLWYTVRSVIFNSSQGFGIYSLILLFVHAYAYYRNYQAAMLLKVQLEGQLSQAQLQALKMQLQPHFLFNTLHSISALLTKDKEAARTMIARLGDFLRLTLENSGTQEVTLQQEIEFLTCYLEIQRIRFQDRLTTSLDVEAAALDTQVPNLILQPIVENAIRHGIAQRSTPGFIEIQAKRQNGVLRIQVRDNGPGLPENRSPEKLFQKGLGLANTQTRLERLYGDGHRFELANDPSGGLIVTLEIPATSIPGPEPSLS
jgi:two-component system, LytTR family, sensor kinase